MKDNVISRLDKEPDNILRRAFFNLKERLDADIIQIDGGEFAQPLLERIGGRSHKEKVEHLTLYKFLFEIEAEVKKIKNGKEAR